MLLELLFKQSWFVGDLALAIVKNMPNASFVLHSVCAVIIWLEIVIFLYPEIALMALLYTMYALWLDYGLWKNGVDAIRYIDPSWSEQTDGILYPSILVRLLGMDDSK